MNICAMRRVGKAMAARTSFVAAALCLTALLTSCGGDGSASADGTVVRLEVEPSTVLLTRAGDTRSLTVRAYDASDTEVTHPPLAFASSQPGQVSVTAEGVVGAVTDLGSAMITVSSGAVTARPLLVAVAEPAPGSITVTDEQVVLAPTPADASIPAGDGFRYRVSLSGIGVPAPGTPIIGLGAQPIAGTVVSAVANGAQTDLVMELGDLASVFKNLQVSFSYTPAQSLELLQVAQNTTREQAAAVTRSSLLSTASCKSDVESVPLTGDLSLKIDPSVKIDGDVEIKDSILQRLLIQAAGTMDASGKATLGVGAAMVGTLKCKVPVGRIPVPITGVLSFFIAPVIPIEARLSVGLTISDALFNLGAEIQQRAEFAMGVSYSLAEGHKIIDDLTLHEPTTKTALSGPLSTGPRARATVSVGVGSGLALGNFLAALDLLDLSVGPEFDAKFGGLYDAARDATYKTGYELKAKVSLGPGDQIKDALKRLFGSDKVLSFSVKLLEKSLGKTVQGATLVADKDDYQAGQTIGFDLQLDPATVDFPAFGYDVSELRVYRLDPNLPVATLIGSVPAAAGQTQFSLSWVADVAGSVVDKATGQPNFYVFAVDGALQPLSSVLPFEVGGVAGTKTPPLNFNCDASKRFCAVSVGEIHVKYVQLGDDNMALGEDGTAFISRWGGPGRGVTWYPSSTSAGTCSTSYVPNRGTLPSRGGRFVLKDAVIAQDYLVETLSHPCTTRVLRLPTTTADGTKVRWSAVADGPWVAGNIQKANGTPGAAVRVDSRLVDATKTAIIGAVEVLPVDGAAWDMRDDGTIVGIMNDVSLRQIFVHSDTGTSFVDMPSGADCFFGVWVNGEGSLLASCSTASGTYAYVRMAGSGGWTKVTASGGGPEPAFFFPGRVNSAGQVVASTVVQGVYSDIVLWQGGQSVSLLANTGFDKGEPVQLFDRAAINDQGEITIAEITDAAPDSVDPVVHVYLVRPNAAYQSP